MTTCGYHFANGQRCNETIYRADMPTGWRHEQGDESRGMCHFARPEESGPQAKVERGKLLVAVLGTVGAIAVLLTCFGCSLRHGWSPSNYRSRPLPPNRIECWQPGEHWSENGQSCHDVRGERDGNKELP